MNSNPPTFENSEDFQTSERQSPESQNLEIQQQQNFPQSSSDTRPTIAEDYSKTFNRLLEEKEALIQDLFFENQRLSQNQQIPRILSPKSLSPDMMSPKEINYKRLLDLENLKTQLEERVKSLEKELSDVKEYKGISEDFVDNNLKQENNMLKVKIQKLNQELSILSRRLEKPLDNENDEENNDIAEISRLRAFISQMKFKEEQNTHEIDRLIQANQELFENRFNNSGGPFEGAHSSISSSGNRSRREFEIVKSMNQDLENRVVALINNENLLNHQLESLLFERQQLLEESDPEYLKGLKRKILELEAHIFGLSDENAELKASRKQSENILIEVKALKEALSQEYEALKVTKENLNQENDTLRKKNYEIKEKIEEILIDKQGIAKLNEELKRKINQISSEKAILEEQNKELRENSVPEKEEILGELNDLRQKIQTLKSEKIRISSESKQQLDQKIRETNELSDFIQNLHSKNADLEINYRRMQSENEIINAEIFEMKREIVQKNEKVEFYAEEIQSYLLRIETIEMKKSEQEIIIRELDDQKKQRIINEKALYEEKTQILDHIKGLKAEMLSENERFNEIFMLQESHLRFLKERYVNDMKDLICKLNKSSMIEISKVLDGYKESSFAITHKEAVIKQLKDKIKSLQGEIKTMKLNQKNLQETMIKAPKFSQNNLKSSKISNNFETIQMNSNTMENTSTFVHINRLESQIFSMKIELKKMQEEINFRKDMNEALEEQLKNKEKDIDVFKEREITLEKELNEKHKMHKTEINDLLRKNDNLHQEQQENNNYCEQYEDLLSQLKEADQALAQSKEEILRKNIMIQALKIDKEESQLNFQQMQENNEKLNEELEKLKKSLKENTRKNFTYKDFKDKLDQSKNSEKLWNEERNILNEKLKLLKTDLARKELFNKELKEKLDQALGKLESLKVLQDENEKLKENLRKYKGDIERKETSLGLLKGKIDECLNENNQLKITKIAKTFNIDQEKENKKIEFTKSSLKKSENQSQMLVFILKRLFRETFTNVKKLKNRLIGNTKTNITKGFDERTLSESLNILKLSPQELNEFLQPRTRVGDFEKDEGLMERFEEKILDSENINVNEIYAMFYNLIEERIKLEKNI